MSIEEILTPNQFIKAFNGEARLRLESKKM